MQVTKEFKMKGLLTLKGMSPNKVLEIINTAIAFKNGSNVTTFSNKKMVTLFYENSTRTQSSFLTAMINLGIAPLSFSLATSSVNKGESLYDTVRTFESIGMDGIVIRHGINQYYNQLKDINIPIFNAGDGTNEHPTQTLLDLMTIYQEFGKFEGLKVCLVGDISHSRVAHGNAVIMKSLGMEVCISGPQIFMDDTAPCVNFDSAINTCDVINLLRVQFERHCDNSDIICADEYLSLYGMTMDKVSKMKDNAIIIHPAPVNRGMEIADEVVECSKSRIFTQMTNGVYIRMAIIAMTLEGKL